MLLAAGVAVDAVKDDNYTALHAAVIDDNVEATAELLNAHAPTEAQASGERLTSLHIACRDSVDVAHTMLLLAHGANVAALDTDNWTPLHYAARRTRGVTWCGVTGCGVKEASSMGSVMALLAAGAAVTARDDKGRTPLMCAAVSGTAATARLLIAKDGSAAHLDAATTANAETALHLASFYGKLDIVEALIAAGARVDAATLDGKPSLAIARHNGHADICAALLAAGASEVDEPLAKRRRIGNGVDAVMHMLLAIVNNE
jgi:ankyrin repeat protein